MQFTTIRTTTVTLALLSATATLLTGCGPVGGPASPAPVETARPTPPAATGAPAIGTNSHHTTARRCTAADLRVGAARQAAHRPRGTGTGAVVVGFRNVAKHTCVVKGFPTVAAAGQGSPQHNRPLTVRRAGSASPVTLKAGRQAWVKITFVQVQGEADGYCVSGSTPVVHPTVVIGVPGAGKHQTGLTDGQFAQCDNRVRVTAFSSAKPS